MHSISPRLAGLLLATATVAGVSCTAADGDALAERQDAVAAAGAEVMPFDLDETTHIFTNTVTGGIQDVVADDLGDAGNIERIRLHLDEEALKFQRGNFADPEAIHGPEMPGLATLKARYDEIAVEVSTTDDGARITYTATEPELIDAVHQWFLAQAGDHGEHAEHNS